MEDEVMATMMMMMIEGGQWMCDVLTTCMLEWKEVKNDRPLTGSEWILDQLEGHSDRCYDSYRMSVSNFNKLCNELKAKGLVSCGDVIIEEQVGMFLQVLGHTIVMRKVGEDFQHSIETVCRCFHNVLRCVLLLGPDYIKSPGPNAPVHPKVSEGTPHAPFKDALGAIDGTHIQAIPNRGDRFKERFGNRKQVYSQNVMAAVDFDGNFIAVVAGWEGSAHDNMILRRAVNDGFTVPQDRYYLVDGGYANTPQFLAPYRHITYHLAQFRARGRGENRYECPEELFNHRHAQLRNIVEKIFGVLKGRFKILQQMRPYKYEIQVKIVTACCILHNFIKYHNSLEHMTDESFFNGLDEDDTGVDDDSQNGDVGGSDTQNGVNLRDRIRDALWQMM